MTLDKDAMASRAREFPAEREKPRVLNQRGEFDGSFSGAVRRRSVVDCLPWSRRREYYLEGWTDPNIWRAAVSLTVLFSRGLPLSTWLSGPER